MSFWELGKIQKHLEKGLNSSPEVFWKKVVIKGFVKFVGKNMCQSLFNKNVSEKQLLCVT